MLPSVLQATGTVSPTSGFVLSQKCRFRESGIGFVIIAVAVTLVLRFWPKMPCVSEETSGQPKEHRIDHLAIPRVLLVALLLVLLVVFGCKLAHQSLFVPVTLSPIQQPMLRINS